MAKKIIKNFLPDPSKIKDTKSLRWLGSWIHEPNLWHLNRRSVSLAFFIGFFLAFLPFPFQMLAAAALAILFRANLPVAVSLVWITNPLTIAPMSYFSYRVGITILQIPEQDFNIELTWEWLTSGLSHIWEPLLLGSFVCGTVSGIIAFIGIRLFWRWHVVSNWTKRKERRKTTR